MLVVDYFSRYPEIVKMRSTTSKATIEALKSIFARHGIPETLISDNGPQYSSKEFAEFAKSYDFCHVTSSPHFPQSNGMAERMVQTIKRLLKEAVDPFKALLNYRATPLSFCNISPSQLLMGRQLRNSLPQIEDQLIPNWTYLDEFKGKDKEFKRKQKANYD